MAERWLKACARNACVEVSESGIRDSKDLAVLPLPHEQVAIFIAAAKNGEFDELRTGEV